jgi:ATP-dependent DNA helicase DinG
LSIEFFPLNQKKTIKPIIRACNEFIHSSQNINSQAQSIFQNLNVEYQLALIELNKLTSFMITWSNQLMDILEFSEDNLQGIRWVSYIPEHIENTFQIHMLKWGEKNSFIDYLAMNSKVVFTSSTLSFRESEDYFSGQVKNLPMQFHRLGSPFDYGEQVRVMLPENRINPKEVRKNEYAKLLAKDIAAIISQTHANSIVLFRSLKVLEEVYNLLSENPAMKDHLILAQSISGTRNRIIKNFKRNHPAVILGADSFFEGIDLPDEELELVILTRLPFPAPNAPITRMKTEYLKQEGVHPFMGEFLPQAVLKFKQAFGRLIRNKTDRGVLIILDDRFVTASYSKIFTEALPQGVPIQVYENKQLGQKVQDFLDDEKTIEDDSSI